MSPAGSAFRRVGGLLLPGLAVLALCLRAPGQEEPTKPRIWTAKEVDALVAANRDPMPAVRKNAEWQAAKELQVRERGMEVPPVPEPWWGDLSFEQQVETMERALAKPEEWEKIPLYSLQAPFDKYRSIFRRILKEGPVIVRLAAAEQLHKHGEPGMAEAAAGIIAEDDTRSVQDFILHKADCGLFTGAQVLRASKLLLRRPELQKWDGTYYSDDKAVEFLADHASEPEEKELLRALLRSPNKELTEGLLLSIKPETDWVRPEDLVRFLDSLVPIYIAGPAILALGWHGTPQEVEKVAAFLSHWQLAGDAIEALGWLKATAYEKRLQELEQTAFTPLLIRAKAVVALSRMGKMTVKAAGARLREFIRLADSPEEKNRLPRLTPSPHWRDPDIPEPVPGLRERYSTSAGLKTYLLKEVIKGGCPWTTDEVLRLLGEMEFFFGIPRDALKSRLEEIVTLLQSRDDVIRMGATHVIVALKSEGHLPALVQSVTLARTAENAHWVLSKAYELVLENMSVEQLTRTIPVSAFVMEKTELREFLVKTNYRFAGAEELLCNMVDDFTVTTLMELKKREQRAAIDTPMKTLLNLVEAELKERGKAAASLIRLGTSPEVVAKAFSDLKTMQASDYISLGARYLDPPYLLTRDRELVEWAARDYLMALAGEGRAEAAIALAKEGHLRWQGVFLDYPKLGNAADNQALEDAALIVAADESLDVWERVSALGLLEESRETRYLTVVTPLLQHSQPDIRAAAERVLFAFGTLAPQEYFLKYLVEGSQHLKADAARVLLKFQNHPARDLAILSALAREATEEEVKAEWLVDAYLHAAGSPDVAPALPWLGGRAAEHRPGIPRDRKAAARVIAALRNVAQAAEEIRLTKSLHEALKVAREIAQEAAWEQEDLPVLQSLAAEMERKPETEHLAGAVRGLIAGIEERHPLRRAGRVLLVVVLAQPVLWAVILLLYPRWRMAQRMVWSRGLRRWLGWGWVGAVLVRTGWLRRWLWRPFREELVPPEEAVGFDEWTFFDGVQVTAAEGGQRVPALTALRDWTGLAVLSGASGLGKTTLLHAVAATAEGPVAFLRAVECPAGVPAALAARLPLAVDRGFLKALLVRGSPALLVDAVHEAAAPVRQAIVDSLLPGMRVLLSTQPAGWKAPDGAVVWDLQPLRPQDLREFLLKQGTAAVEAAGTASLAERQRAFAALVESFLARVASLPPESEEAAALQRMLGNPMEAVLSAELLAAGQTPDPACLMEQRLEQCVQDFETETGNAFPAEALAASLQRSRREGAALLLLQGLDEVAEFLARHRLLRTAADGGWRFRHDKILEWFAAGGATVTA